MQPPPDNFNSGLKRLPYLENGRHVQEMLFIADGGGIWVSCSTIATTPYGFNPGKCLSLEKRVTITFDHRTPTGWNRMMMRRVGGMIHTFSRGFIWTILQAW